MADQKTANGQKRGIKEIIRKSMVSLKRTPHVIPLVFLVLAFLIYSLNLSSIANTTARINGANMGQCEFVAMLFSILAFVVFIRTFPRRKPANKIMLGLLFFMLALLVFVDIVYLVRIVTAVTRAENPIVIDEQSVYIKVSQAVVTMHIIFVGVTAVLLGLLPFYSKIIRKINTSIEVEGNEDIEAIDISYDED
ncbi:MAG: hypothetical protein II820_05900 [Ruminiclostridium sp.]|nr:hypothetical protein [Ruminiclostridium sp.]